MAVDLLRLKSRDRAPLTADTRSLAARIAETIETVAGILQPHLPAPACDRHLFTEEGRHEEEVQPQSSNATSHSPKTDADGTREPRAFRGRHELDVECNIIISVGTTRSPLTADNHHHLTD